MCLEIDDFHLLNKIKLPNVGHFYTFFTRFSLGFYFKITFFMVYDEKNCCFSTFAQHNSQSQQTKKV